MEGKALVRRTILTGLLVGICGMMTCVFADEPPPKQEKEKSELAKIMNEIDKSYKAVEEISGYYKYSDNDWKVIAESSANIAKLTKIIISKFSRPDDQKYQDLNKTLLTESEKMHEIFIHSYIRAKKKNYTLDRMRFPHRKKQVFQKIGNGVLRGMLEFA